jgi:glycosyltransferase involved in cell wall biosynthesis
MELNRNYIPFRGIVLKSISHAVCISDHGASYIRRNYGSIPAHILVHRLGTLDHGTFRWDVAETLRIISCSIVDDNKRVGLIAQAIGNLNFPVRWTHIGDGPCMDDLLKQCRIMQNEGIRIDLLGRIPNPKVHLIYQQEQFDLFINMSISEGIPFSIMEALSYSIPVIATAVGGIPEIINTACGQLMPVDLSVPDLKIQMEKYYLLSKDQKLVLRLNARKQWEQLCNAENNYRNFTVFLENL